MRLLSMCPHLSDLGFIMRGNHTRHIYLGIGRSGYVLACTLIQHENQARAASRAIGPGPGPGFHPSSYFPSLPLSFMQYMAVTPRLPS
jgi:hypothetical protein